MKKKQTNKKIMIGVPVFGTSQKGELVDIFEFVKGLPNDKPSVFVFGAHPKGPVKADYTEQTLAISQYPLSASAALSRILAAFEKKWDIL